MKTEHSLELPRRLQIEFSRVVQEHTDSEGGEVTPERMWEIFQDEFLANGPRAGLLAHRATSRVDEKDVLSCDVRIDGEIREIEGVGNGPVSAFEDALATVGIGVRVLDYAEHAMSAGGDARAAAYVECEVDGTTVWGVGIDGNIVTASLKAILSAVNRVSRTQVA
jgi:2-isopropylmalate synthase